MVDRVGSTMAQGRAASASGPDRGSSPLARSAYVKAAFIAVLLGLLFRHEITHIVRLWTTDPSWSHGFLIPLFSLYFLYRQRAEILALQHVRDPLAELLAGGRPAPLTPGQTRPDYLGLVLLLGVLAFYAFNVVSPAGYAYFRPLSLIAALGAVVWFLGGRRLLVRTWLPIAFLIFAVPLPRRYYVELTIPLRRIAATTATALLNSVGGIEAHVNGVVIDIAYHGRHLEPALDVEEACSGMRLLMAFAALGVAMAYLHERRWWQRLVLLVSTVPIAILCNIVRVTATGFIYVLVDPKYAQGVWHDALGLAMLPLALGFYGFLAWFMSSLFVDETPRREEHVIVRTRVAR
ncbi:MAG: exosortase/archaeosortase family protein [Sedimentisphaerales bacterium]|nr:exosortase/archaeosortase family protein [Sedimentisphaerales bacterium]